MNQIAGNFTSIEQVTNRFLDNKSRSAVSPAAYSGISFQELFAKKADTADTLKFSKHAASRLEQRDITLSPEQSERLNQGALKAGEKGIKDSLVVVDSLRFIVNIPNQTVITALDSTQEEESIFTNIDGTVFA